MMSSSVVVDGVRMAFQGVNKIPRLVGVMVSV